MSKKLVVGLSGNIGAGKGTVTNYLVQSYHAHNLRYSHILQDILSRLNLPYNRKNLAILAESLRSAFGGDILSNALVAEIDRINTHIVVIDGIRKKDELDALRKVDEFYFMFIDADMEVRYNRISERNEKVDDRMKTFEEFKKDHFHISDKDVPSLKEYADFVVNNNGSYNQMSNQVSDIMRSILR